MIKYFYRRLGSDFSLYYRPPTRCHPWWSSASMFSVGWVPTLDHGLHTFRSSRRNCGWGRSKGKRAAAPATRPQAYEPAPRPRPRFTCSLREPLPVEAPSSPAPVSIVDPFRSLPSARGFWVVPFQWFQRRRRARCSGCQVEAKRMGGRGRRALAVLAHDPAVVESTAVIRALRRAARGGAVTAGAGAAGRGAAGGLAVAVPPPPCCTSAGGGRAPRRLRLRRRQRLATLHPRVRCHMTRCHMCSALPFHPVKRMCPICTIWIK